MTQWVVDKTQPREPSFTCHHAPLRPGELGLSQLRRLVMGDVLCRYYAARGRPVRRLIVWDTGCVGAAAGQGAHAAPGRSPDDLIASDRRTLERFGLLGQATREVVTHSVQVEAAAQRLFVQLFTSGLAYRRGSDWFLHVRALGDRLRRTLTRLSGWPRYLVGIQQNWLGVVGADRPLVDWRVSRWHGRGARIPIASCAACGDVPQLQSEAQCALCQGPARPYTSSLDPRFVALVAADAAGGDGLHSVSLYVAGTDQAHLLYARFLQAALAVVADAPDLEPYVRVLAPGSVRSGRNQSLGGRGGGSELVTLAATHGGDAARLALLAGGPPSQDIEWNTADLRSVAQRLEAVVAWAQAAPRPEYRPMMDVQTLSPKDPLFAEVAMAIATCEFDIAARALLRTIDRCSPTAGPEAIAATRSAVAGLAWLAAPFIPHTAARLRGLVSGWCGANPWRVATEVALQPAFVTLVVQVDGRVRERLRLPPGTCQDVALAQALRSPRVQAHLRNRPPHRVVYVADRVLNLVTKS